MGECAPKGSPQVRTRSGPELLPRQPVAVAGGDGRAVQLARSAHSGNVRLSVLYPGRANGKAAIKLAERQARELAAALTAFADDIRADADAYHMQAAA